LFKRDVTRIADYFEECGVDTDSQRLFDLLWVEYASSDD